MPDGAFGRTTCAAGVWQRGCQDVQGVLTHARALSDMRPLLLGRRVPGVSMTDVATSLAGAWFAMNELRGSEPQWMSHPAPGAANSETERRVMASA